MCKVLYDLHAVPLIEDIRTFELGSCKPPHPLVVSGLRIIRAVRAVLSIICRRRMCCDAVYDAPGRYQIPKTIRIIKTHKIPSATICIHNKRTLLKHNPLAVTPHSYANPRNKDHTPPPIRVGVQSVSAAWAPHIHILQPIIW